MIVYIINIMSQLTKNCNKKELEKGLEEIKVLPSAFLLSVYI